MLFEHRIPDLPATPTSRYALNYDRYLRERRGRKEAFYQEVTRETKGINALEVSGGWGYTGIDVLMRSPGLHMKVLAEHPVACQVGLRNALEASVEDRCTFVIGSEERIPLADQSVDIVVSTNRLHRWERPLDVIREMARVTRRGGIVWINDLRRDPDEFIVEYVIRELRRDTSDFGSFALDRFVRSWRASYLPGEIERMLQLAQFDTALIMEDGALAQTIRIDT
uniref:Methyltransferase domain-containing protein n=1 Tax=Candidatus Kentrum sp. MB TaxID=2138164 RepID=A0A451B977_9GAMM|nr:MAG: Methyltransferase domain-containing protein [Candidatus Kentron sp. MB]VFK29625.1 MAG: Methyltransferase domain-containing protein [Candidatus Kentron sp. MB]VFK74840.1 MAG: Methyltransferase domain-containing protein [Candidatus Kentron sp. MB]